MGLAPMPMYTRVREISFVLIFDFEIILKTKIGVLLLEFNLFSRFRREV